MPSICLCFKVHSALHLHPYSFFDFSNGSKQIFDTSTTKAHIGKIATQFFLPLNQRLRELMSTHKGNFRVSFCMSGTMLEQLKMYHPEVVSSFGKLGWLNGAEFLLSPYYHSLAFFYSKSEFLRQVKMQSAAMRDTFDQEPMVFLHPDLFYNDQLASVLANDMRCTGILGHFSAEVFKNRSTNYVYAPAHIRKPSIIVRNRDYTEKFLRLFQPSSRYAAKDFVQDIRANVKRDQVVTIYLDYETLYRRNAQSAVWVEAFTSLAAEMLKYPEMYFMTPSMVVARYNPIDSLSPIAYSHDDTPTLTPLWFEDSFRKEVLMKLYEMEEMIMKSNDAQLINTWSNLQTLDYFKKISQIDKGNNERFPFAPYTQMTHILASLQEQLRHNYLYI